MDEYPDELSPLGEHPNREKFAAWWARVGTHFPYVPRNVARQWLYRHWNMGSPFSYIPSAKARFRLEHWGPAEILQVLNSDPNAEFAPYGHRAFRREVPALWITRVMERRHRWPVPPIVLNNLSGEHRRYGTQLPQGYVLVEGHHRMELAHALLENGVILPMMPLWILDLMELPTNQS